MKQVVQNLKDGNITVPDLPAPLLQPGGILVHTACSVISPGTEGARTALARESLLGKARRRPDLVRQVIQSVRRAGLTSTLTKVKDRLDTPKAPGYSLSGQVLEVAPDVTEFRVGDRVACAGEGHASHAEIVFVPRNLAARVPDGLGPEPAAFATLGAIALHGVRQLDCRLGETAVVLGLGLIGQIAWQLLEASGVHAVGVDLIPEAVDRARATGLKHAYTTSSLAPETLARLTSGLGADGVLVTAGSADSEPVKLAGALCRDRGRVVLLGAVRADLPRSPYYEKEIEVRMSRSYGPGRYDQQFEDRGMVYPAGYVRWTETRNLASFMDLCISGRVSIESLVGERFPLQRAAEAYGLLTSADRPRGQALVLSASGEASPRWPSAPPPRLDRVVASGRPAKRQAPSAAGTLGIGLLGAGHFARSVLLPGLGKAGGVRLTGVTTAHPHTASHVANRFGFGYATSDPERIIGDPEIAAVLIATRHDSHADLARRCLQNGKSVLAEKPLALNAPSLESVLAAAPVGSGILAVGFNRRLAPLLVRLREALPPGAPRQIILRVNAGPLPEGHWLKDPAIGGGRVIGEGCHFFDLALLLAESQALGVRALGTEDSFSAAVEFENGSTASIIYTSDGDGALGKERYEVYSGGVAAILDDFRLLEIYRNGRRHRFRNRRQDKGHDRLITAFLAAVRGAGPSPTSADSLAAAHLLTFDAAQQLRRS